MLLTRETAKTAGSTRPTPIGGVGGGWGGGPHPSAAFREVALDFYIYGIYADVRNYDGS